MFETIVGNQWARRLLQKQWESGVLPHAFLFTGPRGVGKALFAKEMAREILQCGHRTLENHPDFHLFVPEGKSGLHPVEAIRELIDDVHKAPFEGKGRIFLIEDAERMLPASSNALLKTLEEPTPATYFYLLTSRKKEILPTILSRLTSVSFCPLSTMDVEQVLRAKGVDPKYAPKYAQYAEGSIGRALTFATGTCLEAQLFPILSGELTGIAAAMKIKEIEEMVNDAEPMAKGEIVERLFAVISMWSRDQVAADLGQPLLLNMHGHKRGCSWKEREKKILKARAAWERNMKFSACLEHMLSNL